MLSRATCLTVAAFLLGSLAIAAADDAPAKPKLASPSQFFDSNGVKIHYTVQGEGEPVLLIHGFTMNIAMQWTGPGVLPELAKQYRVIAIDNRGHGRSGKPHEPEKYGLEMAEDQIRLLDHLGVKKAHVVGYSMGGFITSKLLTSHPDRVATATLGGAGWTREGDQRVNTLNELADSLEAGKGIGPLIEHLTPPGKPKPTEDELRTINSMVMLMNDPKALAAIIRGMQGLMVPEEALRKNKVPTLALIGSIDPLKDGVDAMEEVMSQLEVVEIEGADHMNAPARPEFISNLKRFLAAHPIGKSAPQEVAEPVAAGK